MALRMIVAWMATVGIVVFVALVVEIITTTHTVRVGDVVTDHPNCSQIGIEILQDGGNAVDAAVAAGLCLTVTTPSRAGLGGGGVMMVHQLRSNRTIVIDFQEKSPDRLPIQKFQDNPKIALWGKRSVGVPGLVAGLYHAQQQYGSNAIRLKCCSWGDLVDKTLNLLQSGFQVDDRWNDLAKNEPLSQKLSQFIKQGGYSQPQFNEEIMNTFNIIYKDPLKNFYNGTISINMTRDTDGHLSRTDMGSYTVEEREALTSDIGDHRVITSPAPTAGPELLALLNTMEKLVSEADTSGVFESDEYFEKITQAMENIHLQQRLLGDPAGELANLNKSGNYFSPEQRTAFLVSKENVDKLMSDPPRSGLPISANDYLQTGTQVSVMDDKDFYVSMILSLNGEFGSGEFSSGFLLNNALASFDLTNLGEARGGEVGSNQFREAARPLYRAAPVVTLNREHTCGTRLVTGSLLAEVTAQVLGPVLLANYSDFTSLVREPRLVLVNNQLEVHDSGRFKNSNLLKYASKSNIPDLDLSTPVSSFNLLEKTIDTIHGHSQNSQFRGQWRTLKP